MGGIIVGEGIKMISVLIFLISFTCAQQFSYQGCYSSSDLEAGGLSSKGTYQYQSVSYCQEQCGDVAVVALSGGTGCYCGDSASFLGSLEKQSSSSCNTACAGWPYQTCGGSSAMDVYVNEDAVDTISSGTTSSSSTSSSSSISTSSSKTSSTSSSSSSNSHSSSSSSSSSIDTPSSSSTPYSSSSSTTTSNSVSSSSSTSSDSSKSSSSSSSSSSSPTTSSSSSSESSGSSSPSSSPSSTTTSSSSSNVATSIMITTQVVTTSMKSDSDNGQQTIFITKTSVIAATPSSSSSTSASNSGDIAIPGSKAASEGGGGLSGGAIAGIVVGVICGVLAIVALVLFFMFKRHRRNQEPDLEETKQYQPYSFGDADANPIILPNTGSTSNWRKSSRNDLGSNDTNSLSYGAPAGAAAGSLSTSNSLNRGSTQATNIFAAGDNGGGNIALQTHPSTVFEEPPFLYEGNQRFSTGSLPDMMEERQLRVVNPDDSISRLDERHEQDHENDDDEDIFTSTGSSRDSPMDHEPKE